MSAASVFPAKIVCPPSTERVRIVFKRLVAVLGGDDVAGDEGGDDPGYPDRAEEQEDERDRQPGVVDVAAEGDFVRLAALGDEGADEDQRHDRGAQPSPM